MAKTPEKTEKTARPSAAARFKELIMAGKLTDDQIFDKVAQEFGLDDSKRNYVGWYRNALRKEGASPPDPKGGTAKTPKAAAAKPAPATAGKKGGAVEKPTAKKPAAKSAKKPAAKKPAAKKPAAKKPAAPRKPKAPKTEAPPTETDGGSEPQES